VLIVASGECYLSDSESDFSEDECSDSDVESSAFDSELDVELLPSLPKRCKRPVSKRSHVQRDLLLGPKKRVRPNATKQQGSARTPATIGHQHCANSTIPCTIVPGDVCANCRTDMDSIVEDSRIALRTPRELIRYKREYNYATLRTILVNSALLLTVL
jgi:hypothetical protein